MKSAVVSAIVERMDKAPWRQGEVERERVFVHDPNALGGPVLGERVLLRANQHTPLQTNIDNLADLVLLRNIAGPLLALWLAVERRQATRCWSRSTARTFDPECLCGIEYHPVCPCTAADVAVTTAFKALEALP